MLFIFDWDGTLSDSTERIVGCMQSAASAHDIDVRSAEQIRNIIGLGLLEALNVLYPECSLSTLEGLRDTYSEHYVIADRSPCDFFEGAKETLDSLRLDGHQLTIATGKSRKGLNRVLAGLAMDDYFDATRCADETQSKPAPLMVEELLDELQVRPEGAVVIGDTEYDLEMAYRAGVPSVGVSYGVHSTERLLKHKPIAVIDDIRMLSAAVGL
jgi:phosphoglycolate phosphatase